MKRSWQYMYCFSPHHYVGFLFLALPRRSAVLRLLRRRLHPSYTTLISHHLSYTTLLVPLILHHSSYATHTTDLTQIISHQSSHTTHLTPFISHHPSHTTHLTPPILHHPSYTTHLTPLILHHSSHATHLTPLILRHSSHTTVLAQIISHQSSHTTHLTPPILHHPSYTTHLTPLILHRSSHTTHLTPLISHHSCHTTYLALPISHHPSHTTHLTPPILRHSSYTTHLTPLISHHSSFNTHLTPLIFHSSNTTHLARSAGAVHRAFRRSCGTRGRGWAAAAFCVAGTALGERGVQIMWLAQYTEPSGGAAERVVGAGPRLPLGWQAQHLVNLERRFHGRRSAQSLQEELRNAWSPLGRGCLLRRSRGRAFRRSCGSWGRRWAVAAFCVGAAAEPSGGAADRVVAAGPRLPFVWQARRLVNLHLCTKPLGGAAERVVAAGPRPPFVWQAQRLVNGCVRGVVGASSNRSQAY